MRKLMGFGLCLLLAAPAWGQRGGFGGGRGGGFGFGRGGGAGFRQGGFGGFQGRNATVVGFGTPQNFFNLGIPPIASGLPSLGINAPGSAFFRGIFAENNFPGWSLPYYPFFGGYGGYGGYDYAPSASPSIIVIQPFSPEMMGQPPKPPEPARLEIREYKEPAATGAQPAAAAPSGPQQTFSVALKNGSRDAAMAAWVDDDCLNYLTASGKRQRVALSAIDRDATARLNGEKNLSLWLPPE
jgi:hypothetical protein